MKQNIISFKKRKSATLNSFGKVFSEKQFLSSQIWNLDESEFPTDAGRCKVVTPKREIANKITPGAGRENITGVSCLQCFRHGY